LPSLSAITNASSASGGGGGLGVCNDDVGKPYQLADVGRIQSDKVHGPRGRKICTGIADRPSLALASLLVLPRIVAREIQSLGITQTRCVPNQP